MSFMQPEIIKTDAYEVSANHGETHIIPADVIHRPGLSVHPGGLTVAAIEPFIEGTIDTDDDDNPIVELKVGVYLARLSAPGYMDCTDWSLHASLADAEAYLSETYGSDDDSDDVCSDCGTVGPTRRGPDNSELCAECMAREDEIRDRTSPADSTDL